MINDIGDDENNNNKSINSPSSTPECDFEKIKEMSQKILTAINKQGVGYYIKRPTKMCIKIFKSLPHTEGRKSHKKCRTSDKEN